MQHHTLRLVLNTIPLWKTTPRELSESLCHPGETLAPLPPIGWCEGRSWLSFLWQPWAPLSWPYRRLKGRSLWPAPWASGSSPPGDHKEALCLLPWCWGSCSATWTDSGHIGRYSRLHLSQKVLAKCRTFLHCWQCRSASTKHPGGGEELQTIWVGIIAWVRSDGAFTSVEMVVRGLALIIVDTSAMTVGRTSWERWDGSIWDNMESRILLETPIILSHTPPMWEEWGGWKIHIQPFLLRNPKTLGSLSSWRSIFSSLHAPLKFVPQSERMSFTLDGKKLTKSIYEARYVHGLDHLYMNSMHTETGKDHYPPLAVSGTSICASSRDTPRPKHINAYVGEWWLSTQQIWRSAIFCLAVLHLSLLHVTHLYRCLAMHLWKPTIQMP